MLGNFFVLINRKKQHMRFGVWDVRVAREEELYCLVFSCLVNERLWTI